jgi:hypothetical protein
MGSDLSLAPISEMWGRCWLHLIDLTIGRKLPPSRRLDPKSEGDSQSPHLFKNGASGIRQGARSIQLRGGFIKQNLNF